MQTKDRQSAFRLWRENQARLELANKVGLNNEALRDSAKKIIEKKIQKLREALNNPAL